MDLMTYLCLHSKEKVLTFNILYAFYDGEFVYFRATLKINISIKFNMTMKMWQGDTSWIEVSKKSSGRVCIKEHTCKIWHGGSWS